MVSPHVISIVRLLRVMKIQHISLVAFVITALFLFSGCINIAGERHSQEIERVKSPDGTVDAVLVRGGGGATTGFDFSVFIVPSGTPFDEKSELFNSEIDLFGADHLENLKLVWREPKFLEIRYDKARIFKYRNYWRRKEVQDYKYVVEIKLVPTNDKSSLDEKDKS